VRLIFMWGLVRQCLSEEGVKIEIRATGRPPRHGYCIRIQHMSPQIRKIRRHHEKHENEADVFFVLRMNWVGTEDYSRGISSFRYRHLMKQEIKLTMNHRFEFNSGTRRNRKLPCRMLPISRSFYLKIQRFPFDHPTETYDCGVMLLHLDALRR